MPKVPIGTARPVIESGLGGRRRGGLQVMGPDDIWIGSDDPIIDVTAMLTGKPWVSAPQAKIQTQDRPGQFGLSQYVGHDPYEMELPIKLWARGGSIESRHARLESLAERKRIGGGRLEPPIVKVLGPGVPHQRLKWRIAGIEEDRDRTRYAPGGTRILYVATVKLVQHVADTLLSESLRAVSPVGRPRGIVNRTTTVRAGETSLYDVSRRVYGNPSKAADIANANQNLKLRLGTRLRKGMKLRLP